MARSIKEIKNFNAGLVSNADPREVPPDAPILSYDVDAHSPGGVLRGRKKDRLKGNHQDHAQLKVKTKIAVDTDGIIITGNTVHEEQKPASSAGWIESSYNDIMQNGASPGSTGWNQAGLSNSELIVDGTEPNSGHANWTILDVDGGTGGWSTAGPPVYGNSETSSFINTLTGDAIDDTKRYSLTFTVGVATLELLIGGAADASGTGNLPTSTFVNKIAYQAGTHTVTFDADANCSHLWFVAYADNSESDATLSNVTLRTASVTTGALTDGWSTWASDASPIVYSNSKVASAVNTLVGNKLDKTIEHVLTFTVSGSYPLHLSIGGGQAASSSIHEAEETYVDETEYAVGDHTVYFIPDNDADNLWLTAHPSSAGVSSLDTIILKPNENPSDRFQLQTVPSEEVVNTDFVEIAVTANTGDAGNGTFTLSDDEILSISDSGLITFEAGLDVFITECIMTITYKTSQRRFGFSGTSTLLENDNIIIDDEVMKVVAVEGESDGTLVVNRAQLGTTAAEHDDLSLIYRNIVPVNTITYSSEDGGDFENLITISENGYLDGIYNWNNLLFESNSEGYETTDRVATIGSGINTLEEGLDDIKKDFSGFPLRIKHNGAPTIVERNNSFFIGCGAGNTTKWLGRIKKANLSGLSGLVIQDDKLEEPLKGKEGTDFDKIITFQSSFTDGSSITDLTQLDNVSKALHIGYKRGAPYLYAIDADNGQAHSSSALPISVWNICKCVSTKSMIKIWVYTKNDDADTNIEIPGQIYLFSIPDFTSTAAADSIGTGEDEYFDRENGWTPRVDAILTVHLAPMESVPKASTENPKNYGYASTPFYNQGTQNSTEYTGSQEISDILETVDGSGNGKLWILVSPFDSDDEDPEKGWFKVTDYLPADGYAADNTGGAPFCCFRFLWCSYERRDENGNAVDHINGDEMENGEEYNIYFNDKSFSTYEVNDHDLGSTVNSYRERATLSPGFNSDAGHAKFWWRSMKRHVPTYTATTYNDDNDTAFKGGTGEYTAGASWKLQDSIKWNASYPPYPPSGGTNYRTHNWILLHGGGPWYRDTRPNNGGEDEPVRPYDRMVWSVLSSDGAAWTEESYGHKKGNRPDFYNENHASDVDHHVNFKPIPNSLADLSDLYKIPNGTSTETSMSHVVGCYINFSEGYLLEDLWITSTTSSTRTVHLHDTDNDGTTTDETSHSHTSTSAKGATYGRRIRRVKGTSCLWISSGNLENYGARYNRANGFGYYINNKTGTGAPSGDETQFDIVNLSTTCCNLDSTEGATVRIFKWLPHQVPNRFTQNIRNKFLSEYNCADSDGNVSWIANTNDNNPRYSALFATYPMEEDEDVPAVSEFGTVLKLNTTTELVDKYKPLNAGEDSVALNGLCGYSANVDTTNVIKNTGGNANAEYSPVNTNARFKFTSSENLGATSEKSLSISKYTGYAQAGFVAKQLDDIIPNGPCQFMSFGRHNNSSNPPNANFLVKADFNGFATGDSGETGTIHNIYEHSGVTLYGNSPGYLVNNCSQSVYVGNSGPYETTDGSGTYNTRNLADSGNLKWGHTKTFKLESHNNTNATSSFGKFIGQTEETVPEGTDSLMIGYIWPKGRAAGTSSSGSATAGHASTPVGTSRYSLGDYKFSLFNRSGNKSAFFADLVNNIDFSDVGGEMDFDDTLINGSWPHKLSIYADTKHTNSSVLANIEFTGIEPNHPSGDNTASYANYFPEKTSKWYKISYEYDGYQDSPMNNSDFVYRDDAQDYTTIDVKITLPPKVPARATRLTLWRRNDEAGHYKRIKSIPLTSTHWNPSLVAGKPVIVSTVRDRGIEMENQKYDTYTGISQYTRHTTINYGLSARASDYLFVSHISHPDIEERAESVIVRSVRGKYSQFDPFNSNKMVLNDNIKAMVNFNGKLYVFTNTATIRINPESFIEEDVLKGFGCTNRDGVIVTEYGMYYADRNHIYHHDGTSAKIISNAIDTDDFSGKNVSWQNFASSGEFKALFMPKTSQIGFAVDALDSTETQTNTYIFGYHLLKQRWDVRKLFDNSAGFEKPKATNLQFFNTRYDGTLYTFSEPSNTAGDNYTMMWELGSGDKAGYQWLSKKFSMDMDTVDKRFIKIKIEADSTIDTPTVYVDGIAVSVESTGITSGAGTYEYKLSGSDKKGKTIQFQWGNGTVHQATDMKNAGVTIFSIGVIYRPGKVK